MARKSLANPPDTGDITCAEIATHVIGGYVETGIYLKAPVVGDPMTLMPVQWIPVPPDDDPEEGWLSVAKALETIRHYGWAPGEPVENKYDGLEVPLRPARHGRPEIGPRIQVRLPESLVAEVDALAEAAGVSRAAWIRDRVVDAVQARREP